MTELRTAVPGDTDAVAEIFLRARRAALPYLPSPSSAAELRGFLGGHVASGATTVAVDGERVLGFVVLGVSRVEHLYVDPAVWRRGVGGLLLRHAQQPRRGGVDLWVFQRNAAAIAFYASPTRGGLARALTPRPPDEAGSDELRERAGARSHAIWSDARAAVPAAGHPEGDWARAPRVDRSRGVPGGRERRRA